ncbi:hypothetical protein IC575_013481 [Cucumis melo]
MIFSSTIYVYFPLLISLFDAVNSIAAARTKSNRLRHHSTSSPTCQHRRPPPSTRNYSAASPGNPMSPR